MSFLGEIKRRKVFQVAAVYLVVSWLIMQVIDVVNEPLNLPDWFDTAVIVALAIGLPIALILAWAFDVTPDGVVKDQGDHEAEHSGGRRIEYVLIGLLAVAMVWVLYRVEIDPADQSIKLVADEAASDVLPNSIAVLLCDNLSPDPDNAYFAAGIHESTLNQLAKIRDLVVIARTSMLQYAEDPLPIPEIAKALKVATVMECSVRYANGQVLITAQLIDGQTGAHLWSDEYNRELVDVFAVQAEVARNIATAMQVQLLPDEQARIEKRPTESTEAYEHYLYSLSLPLAFAFPQYLSANIDSLKKAITADPGFAEAYARLALVYYSSPPDRHLASEYAQRAIDLDPTVSGAYYVIGMRDRYYHARQEDARAAFERAIDLSINDPTSLMASVRHLAEQSGDYAEAIRIGQRTIVVAPTANNHSNLGFIYMRAGDLAEAAKYFQEANRLDPGVYINYLNLATTEYLNGNPGVAKVNLDRATQLMAPGATFRVDYMAYLYGLLGETGQAESLIAQQGDPLEDPGSLSWETLGWAILGTRNKELALHVWTSTVDGYLNDDRPVSLGRITRLRDNWLNDPMLEEPEFLELRRRLGFKG